LSVITTVACQPAGFTAIMLANRVFYFSLFNVFSVFTFRDSRFEFGDVISF